MSCNKIMVRTLDLNCDFEEIAFVSLPMGTRAYNVLRINGKSLMSDIVRCTAEKIAGLDMMSNSAVYMILMLKREYLRENPKAIVDFNCKPD